MTDAQPRRFRQALAAVVLVIVGAAAALWAADRASAEAALGEPASQAVFESVRLGSTLTDAMEAVGFARVSADAIPSWFAREVLDAALIEECYASDGFDAVFVSVPSQEGGLSGVRALFEGRGWSVMTDDEKGMMSLVKDEGECTWMTVSAREAENRWDVVLRIRHDSRGMDECLAVGGGS